MKVIVPVLIALALISCAPSAKSPPVSAEEALVEIRLQKQFAAQERMKQIERLYRVGSPILAANAPLCPNNIWPYHGMMLESLSNVPDVYKDAMHIYYGLENQLTAAFIVTGSPADGKIFRGDRIIKANGISIPSGSKGLREFYDVIWMEGRDVTLPITVTVERGRNQKREEVVLQPTAGCASFLAYERYDEVNASADGMNITFTAGMMRVAEDDHMLAGVIGHELAHNALQHRKSKTINALIGQIAGLVIEAQTGMDFSDMLTEWGGGAWSQDFETEADYVGLYMLARTGSYDLDKAIEMERRLAAIDPESIHLAGSTHPSSAKRFLMMKKAQTEIQKKKERGEPLLPQTR